MQKILTIAGSDCSGGAGIQADIKTITAHKMYAMSVITALTAQNTMGVYGVHEAPSEFVKAQMDACFKDIVPNAVKIGMVSNSYIIKAIAAKLKEHNAKNIVIDPVMVATSGGKLMQDSAIEDAINELFCLADIITPNIAEAEILSDIKIIGIHHMKEAALKISQLTGGAVLVKGGHLRDDASDVLYYNGKFEVLSEERVHTNDTHGTGCTLSSAIACALGANKDMYYAVKSAKKFVTTALKGDLKIGNGNGAIDHYFRIPEIF
ncbi:bifunctional hydroxymethylpyrimidine kinase/phosphomethylpyrimidine kinase [Campylobacter fetus]|uniref:bifunctional hydroxymethylpyrimidine kinase/phosphomethylpyrimidine kinase n=1 Tax=Campylobacter fetus TaxID=196 RepID=UPI000FCC7550|nr:bifunctional hydroxymethylpyrimidine kinase/phosphomethylpyrimidine kinase [Campylobacter fetus]RUT51330.1 bifunctional hydroxymethylpyrimidine kinase/phosphomethylpyrimidine kinase [Campylobacter fetus]RUT52059.1 bifunctional hydroxymethylpyrimidine kinase/phosphomethylpyrimidine kinase [Campylobacter fetus]